MNGLYFGRPQPRVGEAAEGLEFMSAQQRQVMWHVERSARAIGPPPGGLRPAEAVSALRAAGWRGGQDADHIGSYQLDEVGWMGRVSLMTASTIATSRPTRRTFARRS